jgi:hypothetical protein
MKKNKKRRLLRSFAVTGHGLEAECRKNVAERCPEMVSFVIKISFKESEDNQEQVK